IPLLPALPIFHSSSSSKSPKLSLVTRSSTGPSLESTPPATCQPTGNPDSFQPRQSGTPSSCKSERQDAEGLLAGSAAANSAAPQERSTMAAYRWILFMVHSVWDQLLRQVQLLEQRGRGPVETRERHVADVTQVLAAHGSRVEAAGGQVAIERKEARRITPSRTRFVTDVIANTVLLSGGEIGKSLAKAARSLVVQPHETAQHDRPVPLAGRIRGAHPLINELDHSDGRGAGGMLVGRYDDVREDPRKAPLWGREGQRP